MRSETALSWRVSLRGGWVAMTSPAAGACASGQQRAASVGNRAGERSETAVVEGQSAWWLGFARSDDVASCPADARAANRGPRASGIARWRAKE